MNQLSEFEQEGLNLQPLSQNYLLEIAKWAKFLAIVGFVFTGLIVIGALSAGSMFATLSTLSPGLGFFSAAGITVLYLLIGILYFFPCYYLFQAAKSLKFAVDNQNSEEVTVGLEKLKSFFKFVGIFTLIIVGLYALGFFFLILGGGLALLGSGL